jgi:hypothetical protein
MVVAAATRTSIASGLLALVYFDFSRREWQLAECYRPPCHSRASPTVDTRRDRGASAETETYLIFGSGLRRRGQSDHLASSLKEDPDEVTVDTNGRSASVCVAPAGDAESTGASSPVCTGREIGGLASPSRARLDNRWRLTD